MPFHGNFKDTGRYEDECCRKNNKEIPHMNKWCIPRTQTATFEINSLSKPHSPSGIPAVQKDFQGKLSTASANFIILEMMLASQCFANERKQRKQKKKKVSDALFTWCIIVNFALFPAFWVGQSVSWEVSWVLQNVKPCVAIYNCPGLWKQMIYHRAQRLM